MLVYFEASLLLTLPLKQVEQTRRRAKVRWLQIIKRLAQSYETFFSGSGQDSESANDIQASITRNLPSFAVIENHEIRQDLFSQKNCLTFTDLNALQFGISYVMGLLNR